jgi:hypothetical protein
MMDEDISPEARAEIEQGKRYRQRPALKNNVSRNIWLVLAYILLFTIALVIARGWPSWFVYMYPVANMLVRAIPVGLIALVAVWGIWKVAASNNLGYIVTVLFTTLIPVALATSFFADYDFFDFGIEATYLAGVRYHDHFYHLDIVPVSSAPPDLYECDWTGTWCHRVDCFPYDGADSWDSFDEYPRIIAERYPVCATGARLPTARP